MDLKLISKTKTFNGTQGVYIHYSEACKCDMTFGLYLPETAIRRKVPLLWFCLDLHAPMRMQ